MLLTHWGRVTHKGINKLIITGSDNDLCFAWCQAIIWGNAGILLILPLGTNFSELLIGIYKFCIQENAFKNVVLKMAAICLGLNVLTLLCDVVNWHSSKMTTPVLGWLIGWLLDKRPTDIFHGVGDKLLLSKVKHGKASINIQLTHGIQVYFFWQWIRNISLCEIGLVEIT